MDSENLGTGSTINLGQQGAVADASGNVTATWVQYDGTRYNAWANRMTANGTWETAAKIETDDAGSANAPALVVDASGNATAVWRKYDGTRYNLRANRFASGAWLATPTALSNGTSYVLGFVSAQQTTGANAGALTLMWQQQDTAAYFVYAAHMTPAGSWGTPGIITADTTAGHSVQSVSAYICPSGTATGNVTAIWYQYDGANYNQVANRMSAAGTWGTATNFSSGGSVWGSWVAGLDAACNVAVVWSQYDGTRYNQMANRIPVTGAFSAASAVPIETENLGDAQPPPTILMDPTTGITAGNATVLWLQYDGTRYNLWANRYNNNTSTWGTAVKVETEDLGSPNTPQAVIGPSGNVTAVWAQSDGVRANAWANRADASGAWAGAQNLTSVLPAGAAGFQDMAFEGSPGTAPLLVGTSSNGSFLSLWASDMR